MGYERPYLDFVLETIDAMYPRSQRESLAMCELGNQHLRRSCDPLTGGAATAKAYFETILRRHVSIDLNGEDGALPIDLNCPVIDGSLLSSFDIVTNSGVSEHVDDHYQCMATLYQLAKPGGLIVHLVPEVGSWPGHGKRWYRFGFFRALDELVGTETLRRTRIAARGQQSQLVAHATIQAGAPSFISRDAFRALEDTYTTDRSGL